MTPWTVAHHAPLCGDSPGKNTGVGYHALLQGILPTQGSTPGFPRCRKILYHLSHQVSPRILEWVAYPFSSRYSWPRNWTGVFCTADVFFTNWAKYPAKKISVQKAYKFTLLMLILSNSKCAVHETCFPWGSETLPDLTTAKSICPFNLRTVQWPRWWGGVA